MMAEWFGFVVGFFSNGKGDIKWLRFNHLIP